MESLKKQQKVIQNAEEKELLQALDKGIDDMEQGQTVVHEEAMKVLREKVKSYGV